MGLHTSDDVNAMAHYHRITKIQNLELRIRKLRWAPEIFLGLFLAYAALLALTFDSEITWMTMMPFGALVATLGAALVKRTDYMAELMTLQTQADKR